ncbi:MAG TPA: prepilin-type N-terminal cleavage/methylation domain-containing protein [Planctomycetota bacterium]|nr:prepilin-type N-terminal cleavage/methylation domain-containing protein [Planctomycetota bacterium]
MPALSTAAPRRAFTMIELLIAVSIGTLLMVVAFAGLRAASSAFATGQRLSTENALMRAGFIAGLDELDFWKGCDDPADGRVALRQVDDSRAAQDHPLKDGLGQPFTPMAEVWDDSTELPGRWEGDAQRWSAHADNQAARWRGNFAECMDTDCRFGRYGVFFNQRATLDIPAYARDNVALPAYGAAIAPRETWWCGQYRGLTSVLGYYGLIDYLPANAIHASYSRFYPEGPPAGDWGQYVNAGGIPVEWLTGPWKVHSWADSNRTPMTRYRATLGYAYGLMAGPDAPADAAALAARHREQTTILHYGTNGDIVRGFIARVGLQDRLTPLRPSHWPEVRTSVLRYFSLGKFFNLCIVRLADPVSGNQTQFSFNGFGTTLRGARQQRDLDSYAP